MIKFYPTMQQYDSSNNLVMEGFKRRFNFTMIDHNNLDFLFMYNYAKFKENGNCGYLLR